MSERSELEDLKFTIEIMRLIMRHYIQPDYKRIGTMIKDSRNLNNNLQAVSYQDSHLQNDRQEWKEFLTFCKDAIGEI
jgi:hypothetical protein